MILLASVGIWIGGVTTAVATVSVGLLTYRASRITEDRLDDENVTVSFEKLNAAMDAQNDKLNLRLDEAEARADREMELRRSEQAARWECEREHAATQARLELVEAKVARLLLDQDFRDGGGRPA